MSARLALQRLVIIAILSVAGLIGCSTPEPQIITVVVTVDVPATVEVPVTSEILVTVEVPVTVEVTRLEPPEPAVVDTPSIEQPTVAAAVPVSGTLTVGQEGRDGNQVYVLTDWIETSTIQLRRDGQVEAPAGAKFIVATVDFFNDGLESVDIYCSFDFGYSLFDTQGRQFDHTGRADIVEMYDIAGNVGCNDNLQPGFGALAQTLAFMLPVDAVPEYLKLWDPNDPNNEERDAFGEISAILYRLE